MTSTVSTAAWSLFTIAGKKLTLPNVISRSLMGAGMTNVVLTAGGQPANSVTVDIE